MFDPDVNMVLEFLLHLFRQRNISYSAIDTARSALSSFVTIQGQPVGQHRLVVRFLKSVFNQRPALPKTNITWDVDQVLR